LDKLFYGIEGGFEGGLEHGFSFKTSKGKYLMGEEHAKVVKPEV
jgi:hypothetical protein